MDGLTFLFRRVSRHGLLGTLKLMPQNIRWAWRQLKPSNLAERRRERALDRELGIETAARLTRGQLEAEWDSPKAPTGYQAVPREIFDEMVGCLPAEALSFCFIDIGSGKGRALALAARRGFSRIIGVELSTTLHRIAEKNFARIGSSLPATIDLVNLDARKFEFPGTPTIAFFANPFADEDIMREVLGNIERAHRQSGEPVFLLYHWPVQEKVILERSEWREVSKGHYRRDWGFEWKAFNFVGAQGQP